jgi:hypothetical protein
MWSRVSRSFTSINKNVEEFMGLGFPELVVIAVALLILFGATDTGICQRAGPWHLAIQEIVERGLNSSTRSMV